MRRLGLGYDEVRAVNPGIVYASASGFGQDGPLADRPGLDIMAQARGGLMSITGTPDGEPAKIGVPVCDLVCGIYTALAVTAALRERDRSGAGQYVDVSLLESGVSLAVWEAGRWFATGEVGGPLGSAHQSQAPYQAFRTADGWATLGAITPRTWSGLCGVLGLEHLEHDERFVDSSSRHARREELASLVEEQTTAVRDRRPGRRAGGRRGAVRPDRRLRAGLHRRAPRRPEFFWDADHPVAGPVRQVGSPMRFSRTPARRAGAGPVLGADTRAALEVAGYGATRSTRSSGRASYGRRPS